MSSMKPSEWGMLILLSIFWGGSFFFVEIALRGFQPFSLVFLRVTIAAIILLGVVYLRGQRLPATFRTWGAYLIMGALNNALPFSLIVWGQTRIDSGVASILNATTPIFTVILAHMLTSDEDLTPRKIIGILTGFIGVYMMLPLFIITTPFGRLNPSMDAIAAVFGIAIISTAMAYLLYFRILASAGATNVLLVTFLVPISALLLGVGVLGEVIHVWEYTGMGCIFLGLIFIDGRLLAKLSGSRFRVQRL